MNTRLSSSETSSTIHVEKCHVDLWIGNDMVAQAVEADLDIVQRFEQVRWGPLAHLAAARAGQDPPEDESVLGMREIFGALRGLDIDLRLMEGFRITSSLDGLRIDADAFPTRLHRGDRMEIAFTVTGKPRALSVQGRDLLE